MAVLGGILSYFGAKREMAPQIVAHFGPHEMKEEMVAGETSAVTHRDVPGFPGYRVGDDGSVWSCWKKVALGGRRGTKSVQSDEWRQLRPIPHPKSGRRQVNLYRGGRGRFQYIAHVVLWAFVGDRPAGMEACHDNGDHTDDRATNLRWDTHQGNCADRVRHGTHNRGVRHNCVKLSEDQVRMVRQRVAAGESRAEVAVSVGVGKQTVVDIVTGRTWKHLV
jgi:DNA-binding XRE family transcriptional regulator